MSQHIEAIYENGLLRPLAPLVLPESTRVILEVHPVGERAPVLAAVDLEAQQRALAALRQAMDAMAVHNPADGWDSSRVDELLYGWKK
jgi:predicted DNA-binding antitoxin AbrB/MazE fold protein